MKTRLIIMLAMLITWQSAAFAQGSTKVIAGQITTLNDLPVSGIKITSKNTKTGVVSDSLGFFSIVCNEKDQLKFEAKVFNTKKIKINSQTPDHLNVQMTFVQSTKNVDLAIGYGYIQEKYRTQAIEYTKNNNNFCNYTNIFDLLRAKFPTLQIHEDGCIIIRGPSSNSSSNCAMYVVDGLKSDKIDYISPCYIKDIAVLKDASSAAIYGVESSNGVILINLIRGGDKK